MEKLRAVYRLACDASEVDKLARSIAYEQTVELPEELITSPSIRERVVGDVESIVGRDGRFQAAIANNLDLTAFQVPQLLNLLFGNISIQPRIKLIDLTLPDALTRRFRGPRFGVEGVRRLAGVHGRPLVATALKPVGESVERLAAIARDFALAGGDIVKDDNNLVDASEKVFRERVLRCKEAVDRANAKTGRRTLYLPNLSAPTERLEGQVEFLLREGIPGVLISPQVAGFDATRYLLERYPLVAMAHPSLTGAYYHCDDHGIDPGLLLGTVFRLLGADMAIFPNFTGRFAFTREQCIDIGRRLTGELGRLAAALPAPAGGMRPEHLDELADAYGEDAVYLIGAALLGHERGLRDGTEALLHRIRERFPERLDIPDESLASSCDARQEPDARVPAEHLEFREDFTWRGRSPVRYKGGSELPFRGVARHELIGRYGEAAAFELRYFEIEPGGFTSLEKHVHTHTIIAVRGEGLLVRGDRRTRLSRLDVAYVPPLEIHQLRNETDEPFGFFCIVDRNRDRPTRP